jgi:hypothetical protein
MAVSTESFEILRALARHRVDFIVVGSRSLSEGVIMLWWAPIAVLTWLLRERWRVATVPKGCCQSPFTRLSGSLATLVSEWEQ